MCLTVDALDSRSTAGRVAKTGGADACSDEKNESADEKRGADGSHNCDDENLAGLVPVLEEVFTILGSLSPQERKDAVDDEPGADERIGTQPETMLARVSIGPGTRASNYDR